MGNRISITLHMLNENDWDTLPKYVLENLIEDNVYNEYTEARPGIEIITIYLVSFTDTVAKIKTMLPRLSNTIVSISDSNDELNSKVFVPRFTAIVIN